MHCNIIREICKIDEKFKKNVKSLLEKRKNAFFDYNYGFWSRPVENIKYILVTTQRKSSFYIKDEVPVYTSNVGKSGLFNIFRICYDNGLVYCYDKSELLEKRIKNMNLNDNNVEIVENLYFNEIIMYCTDNIVDLFQEYLKKVNFFIFDNRLYECKMMNSFFNVFLASFEIGGCDNLYLAYKKYKKKIESWLDIVKERDMNFMKCIDYIVELPFKSIHVLRVPIPNVNTIKGMFGID